MTAHFAAIFDSFPSGSERTIILPHLPSLPSRGNIVAPPRDGEGVVPRAKLGRCIIHLYALLDRGDFCTIFRLNFFSPIFPSFPFFGGKGDD